VRSTDVVSFPSMHRYVIFNGFLLPTVERLAANSEALMPQLTDWEDDLESKDPTKSALLDFDNIVGYISQKALIGEARGLLEEKLSAAWEQVVRCNDVYGDQVKGEIQTETQEIPADSNRGPIGGRGVLRNVNVTMQKMRVESRAVIHRKRGGTPECGAWTDSGSFTTRILESAFESYGKLPIIHGRLSKQSPNMFRKVMLVAGIRAQERACILRDAHFCWWEPGQMAAKAEASGCINFLVHRAVVSVDITYPGYFCIKPADKEGWSDQSSFTGGKFRDFWFDANNCEIGVDEWMNGIQQHIKFADLAYEQLGGEKVMLEVGVKKPSLEEIDI